MNCPKHNKELIPTPITKGERLTGINKFCTEEGCHYEIDIPLNKFPCNKCQKEINYFDKDDLEQSIRKHNYKAHRIQFNQQEKKEKG